MLKYDFNGRMLNIPKAELQKAMVNLGLTQEEAIEMWLEDEGYLENAEQEELCQKAKENKITAAIHKAGHNEKKKTKPKEKKVSAEKQQLFAEIVENLKKLHENVEILNENKLIQVKIGGKSFKIDIIEQRQPKK